jgi:hypothetical protein
MCLPAAVHGRQAESFIIRTAKFTNRSSNWSAIEGDAVADVFHGEGLLQFVRITSRPHDSAWISNGK